MTASDRPRTEAGIADAEAKLAREAEWIRALASGQPAAEVFGLAPPVRA